MTFMICCALLGAVLWRLGGGALTALTGFSLGTDFARAIRAVLGAILCWRFGLYGLAAVPALFLGVIIGGWGPFQGMGSGVSTEPSWKRWLPGALRLKPNTLPYDMLGMAECGVLCMSPAAIVAGVLAGWHGAAVMLAGGLLFAPAYALARLPLPAIPRFASGAEWGEVFTGAVVGGAFALVAS